MRLSVIIPAIGTQQAIEESLISVLTHRPPGCEVLIACDEDFIDLYELDDEVHFVRCEHGGHWAAAANEALGQATGSSIALLLPGTKVAEGWSENACGRLDGHGRLASVAPLVVSEGRRPSPAIAGLSFTLGGRRRIQNARQPGPDEDLSLLRVDGPTRWAGFFRREALLEVGGWDVSMAPAMVDLELAVNLRFAGWTSLCEWNSQVRVRAALLAEAVGYRNARDTERIFWRYLSPTSRVPAILLHPLAVGFERVQRLTMPAAIGELLGRLTGLRSTTRLGMAQRVDRGRIRRAA